MAKNSLPPAGKAFMKTGPGPVFFFPLFSNFLPNLLSLILERKLLCDI